jgi:hypothetical protein
MSTTFEMNSGNFIHFSGLFEDNYRGMPNAEMNAALGRRLQKAWGVDEICEAKIHVPLGYPADARPPTAKPRKDGRIIRIRT